MDMDKDDMKRKEKEETNKDAKRKIAKKKCLKRMGEDDGSDPDYAAKMKRCIKSKKAFGHGKEKKPSKKEHVRKQRGEDMEGEEKPARDGDKPAEGEEKPARDGDKP